MKKNIRNIFLLGPLLTLILSSSCHKKAPPAADEPPPADGTVLLHLHTNVDTSEADYNTVYIMTGGRKISVSMAQLYISGIQLIKADGSIIDFSSLNIAKAQQTEEYIVGNAPAGNYKSIKFNVGLSSSTNAMLPEPNDSTFYKPNMWFGNTVQPWQGYVFVNFQGKIDTSTTANGTIAQMQPFTYRIGTNSHLKSVTMPDQNYTISSNQAQYIHITIDYNKLFSGVTLRSASNLSVVTVADNGGALANQIANNIPLMFKYEQ